MSQPGWQDAVTNGSVWPASISWARGVSAALGLGAGEQLRCGLPVRLPRCPGQGALLAYRQGARRAPPDFATQLESALSCSLCSAGTSVFAISHWFCSGSILQLTPEPRFGRCLPRGRSSEGSLLLGMKTKPQNAAPPPTPPSGTSLTSSLHSTTTPLSLPQGLCSGSSGCSLPQGRQAPPCLVHCRDGQALQQTPRALSLGPHPPSRPPAF